MRRLAVLALLAAVTAVPASAQQGESDAATLAAFRGSIMAVAQSDNKVAWLQWSPDGCSLRIRGRETKAIRSVRYAKACNPYFHDLILSGGTAVFAGDDEILCGKMYATVRVYAGGARPHLVEKLPRNCLGFGPSLRGIVTDGKSVYYNVFKTVRPASAWQCGDLGGVCRYRAGKGHVTRIDGTRAVELRGLPPTVTFSVAAGRIATVQPLRQVSGGAGGWPRAARNGKVEIHDVATGRLEASFRPEGIVRSVALTATQAVVLVELNGLRRLEYYDVRNGRRIRTMAAPQTLGRLVLDGSLVAYRLNDQVRVFDVATGRRWVVADTKFVTIGLSIRNGWVVWGENHNKFAKILVARASSRSRS